MGSDFSRNRGKGANDGNSRKRSWIVRIGA